MHSANSIINRIKHIFVVILALLVYNTTQAQENSPYSRYGLGDLISGQNITNRAMGGFSAAYSDYGLVGSPFNINIANPASLGSLSNTKNFSNTIFDLGGEINSRTLKSNLNGQKYTSSNAAISYLQVAFPISTPKMEKKGITWGTSFGLRPLTRISYKIEKNSRINNIDSLNTLYEGTGGLNQVNLSTGIRKIGKGSHKNEFSLGVSTGFSFGNKSISTRTSFLSDTIIYAKGNEELKSTFGGVFLNAGMQYEFHMKNGGNLRLGAYANFQQKLNANQTTINETFGYDGSGAVLTIDSVSTIKDVKGKIVIPATYGAGFTYQTKNKQWLLGADFETSDWTAYRYYNESDKTTNSWVVKAGTEFYPAKFNAASNKYWNYIKYRAGFYYGTAPIKTDNVRNRYAFTFGTGMPLTTPRQIQNRGEYVALNTSIEIGTIGNAGTTGLKENSFRINFGISMNARWFQKRSYD